MLDWETVKMFSRHQSGRVSADLVYLSPARVAHVIQDSKKPGIAGLFVGAARSMLPL